MSPLSDEYLRSLEPETMRYDVTIFDDFVLSVLPNGVKTWAFLYDYDGRTRRKTLGVYPDMSYEQAEDALDHVREMIMKLDGDIKDTAVEPDTPRIDVPPEAVVKVPPVPTSRPAVLSTRQRQYTNKRKRGGSRLGVVAIVAVLLVVVAGGALLGPRLIQSDRADTQSGNSTATAPPPDRIATASRAAPKPIVLDANPEPIDATPSLAADDAIVADAQADNTAVTPREAPQVPDQTPPAATNAQSAPVKSPPVVADNGQDKTAPSPEPKAASSDVPDAVVPTTVAQTPPAATSAGGDVSRAIVTSGVANIEPVDDLGDSVVLEGAGYRTVFFFTELRNFSAGTIVHRWRYNGRIIADVPLKVGGNWRWRTYSSKDLLPGMIGDWEVSVIDGDGRVLGQREFTYQLR